MDNKVTLHSQQNHESGSFSLRDIFTVLFKHQREIIGIFLFFAVISFIVPRVMTPIYEAKSTLMVKIGREHMYGAEVGDQAPKIGFDLQALIVPEIEILKSRDLSLKVVEELGVGTIYPDILEKDSLTISPPEVAAIKFQGNLSVTKSGRSSVIEVRFEHPNPQIAARAVNVLSELWSEKHLAIFSNPQTSFLEEQVQALRKKMEKSEDALQEFKREHEISSILDQQKLLLQQRQDFDSRSKSNEDQIQGSGSKINAVRRQLKDIPQYIPISTVNKKKDNLIEATRSELLALRRKEQQYLGKYREGSRMVTGIREEIGLIQAYIKDQKSQLKDGQVDTVRNPVYQDLHLELLNTESALTSLKTKRGVILGQINELDGRIARLNRLGKQYEALQREVKKDQENEKLYVEKFEMAKISSEMDDRQMANVSVIQSASIPTGPIKPRKSLTLYLGMALGLLSGVAWAFVSDFFNDGYTRPEKASREQGIPVLASISYKS